MRTFWLNQDCLAKAKNLFPLVNSSMPIYLYVEGIWVNALPLPIAARRATVILNSDSKKEEDAYRAIGEWFRSKTAD